MVAPQLQLPAARPVPFLGGGGNSGALRLSGAGVAMPRTFGRAAVSGPAGRLMARHGGIWPRVSTPGHQRGLSGETHPERNPVFGPELHRWKW